MLMRQRTGAHALGAGREDYDLAGEVIRKVVDQVPVLASYELPDTFDRLRIDQPLESG